MLAVAAVAFAAIWLSVCFRTALQALRDFRASETEWSYWEAGYDVSTRVGGRMARALSALYLAGSVLSAVLVVCLAVIAVLAG